jgi:thermitase
VARRLTPLLLALAGLVLGLAAGPAGAAVPATPNDSQFANQGGLKAIKAPEAWARGTGAGARVAVVSTGIAPHPDLAGKIDGGFDATGANDATLDIDGRGTHLAGIVGAVTNNGTGIAGTAPDARVLPYRAFSTDGSSLDGDAYIRALAEAGAAAPIVLVDLPGGFPPDKVAELQQTLKALGNRGVSVIVGVQSGISLAGLPVLPVAPSAAQAGAQGVGAPGTALSTWVTTVLGVAPEYDYAERSGSNRSAAFAAGAVAILRVLGANSGQAADFLRRTKGADGTIDVAAAVNAFLAPPPPPSTTTTKKPDATTTTKPSTPAAAPPGGPGGLLPVLPGDPVEPGQGEEAVVPPGFEEFQDQPDSGGSTTLLGGGEEDDRPLGALAVGFGLLCGVGTGLSLTFRRLADAPL